MEAAFPASVFLFTAMLKVSDWKKILRFQKKPGWCGPAVVQMILLAADIKKSQDSLAKDVYKSWWGTGQNIMFAYLSKYFKTVNFKTGAKLRDIQFHLKKGNFVIVNWWDDFDKEQSDGHYSIVIRHNKKGKTLTLVDPSRSRKGIWRISFRDFNKRWYDYLDLHGKTWVDGWMLWVDPSSKI